MTTTAAFPALGEWKATRNTLHLYSRILSVVARVHAEPHPKWWHVSLSVTADGLKTDKMVLPHGGSFWLAMDLDRHVIDLKTNDGSTAAFSMAEGQSATEMANRVLDAVADLGVTGDYPRERFENDEPTRYDSQAAERFLGVLNIVEPVFQQYRAGLDGEVSPINFWPHGFDLSVEWYGTRVVEYEEDGETVFLPAQVNLGFYPGNSDDEVYFYSNPWPFEGEQLLDHELPQGAFWHTDGWEGTMLPYAELISDKNGADRLLAFARRVHEITAPTLSA